MTAIEDVQSIRQFIAQDTPHYAELVTQRLIASVERLPAHCGVFGTLGSTVSGKQRKW